MPPFGYLTQAAAADYKMRQQGGGGPLTNQTATNTAGSPNSLNGSSQPPAGVVQTLNKNQAHHAHHLTNKAQTNNGNLPPSSATYQPSQNDPHLAQKLAMQQQKQGMHPSMGQGYSVHQQQQEANQASSSHNVNP